MDVLREYQHRFYEVFEFIASCNQCGVTITEEELAGFASIAKNGEVTEVKCRN